MTEPLVTFTIDRTAPAEGDLVELFAEVLLSIYRSTRAADQDAAAELEPIPCTKKPRQPWAPARG